MAKKKTTKPMEMGDDSGMKVFIHQSYWLQGKQARAIELLVGGCGLDEAEAKALMKKMDREFKRNG